MGFEPTRAEHNGLAVHCLNHSATLVCEVSFHGDGPAWHPAYRSKYKRKVKLQIMMLQSGEEKVAVHKEYNLKRHYTTRHAEEYEKYQGDERANRIANLKTCLLRQQDFFKKATKESNAAVEASYMVSEMIATAGKPFTEGEFVKKCILQAASIICPEKKGQFSNISLSANTVAERISDLSNDIYDQLCEKAKVALDETTDITDTAQLAMYVRGVNDNFEVMEELLRVIPMHGQTTAQEIFCQLCDAIKNAGLPWKRFVGITTDGAPSMTGRKNGLVALVKKKLEEEGVEEAIALHCIIHQQALCSKCLKFDNVMSVVVKCINQIKSRGLKHRRFRAFLEEMESEYGDVLYFTEVRWLSRGNVLKRFFELRAEVKAFMEKDGVAVPVLSDPKWLMDLAFLVDITHELNVLNKKLQGQGQLVSAAYDNALADAGTPFSGEKYVDVILKLQEEFDHRFADFKTHRATFQIFADPFSFDVQDAPPVLQMELIDLQCNSELKRSSGRVSTAYSQAKCGSAMREEALPGLWQQEVGKRSHVRKNSLCSSMFHSCSGQFMFRRSVHVLQCSIHVQDNLCSEDQFMFFNVPFMFRTIYVQKKTGVMRFHEHWGWDVLHVVLYDKQDQGSLLMWQLKANASATRMGFEPTRAEHNGLAVHRLNHSATSSNHQCRSESHWHRLALLRRGIHGPVTFAGDGCMAPKTQKHRLAFFRGDDSDEEQLEIAEDGFDPSTFGFGHRARGTGVISLGKHLGVFGESVEHGDAFGFQPADYSQNSNKETKLNRVDCCVLCAKPGRVQADKTPNNSVPKATPAEGETMVQFMTDWLRKELAIDTDLGIQRAHRALGPKRKPDEPPRSVIINFQRFDVKEKILAKAWAMTPPVKYGDRRVFFDHDYSDRVLKQRRSYDNIKRVLTANKIKFNTPFTKIRIHWNTGKVMYQSATEAAKDVRKRGLEFGDEQLAEVERSCAGGGSESEEASGGNSTLLENLRAAKLSTWQRVDRRKDRTSEASRRAKGKLQIYKR
ncbi:General transcription factor II-I repeat domain-containing protein 2 [Collichthys lucidus]|uniref:General transcription factor II-I repeat domain-containing protein 2 n=1 Tax=Collichthys lucidus TaxID=240159 RepID=A0A4U5TZM3_COLLU|nr:General transcription factor II-I repeat domain-containing protein 2 [Collichthys lucidus]